MCRLFTDFERAIPSCGLFKMDTVGDAYVAAGFFPIADCMHESFFHRNGNLGINRCGHDDSTAANNVCQDILNPSLAGSTLAAVAQYRAETGKEVHCRIGISAGPILAGILGRLQPRFHIFGEGIRKAERKEQSGAAGAVHVSENFMLLVFGTVPPSAAEGFHEPLKVKSCSWVICDKCNVAENDERDNEDSSGLLIVPKGQPLESFGDTKYDISTASRKFNVAASGKDSDLKSHSMCSAAGSEFSTPPPRTKLRRRSFLLFPYQDKANFQVSSYNPSSFQ